MIYSEDTMDEIVTKGSKVCGAVPCVWDNGTGGDFLYGTESIINRYGRILPIV